MLAGPDGHHNASVDASQTKRVASAVPDRYETWNPLMLAYRTADDRFIVLQMLAPTATGRDLCRVIATEKATDPRFLDMAARKQNARSCVSGSTRCSRRGTSTSAAGTRRLRR